MMHGRGRTSTTKWGLFIYITSLCLLQQKLFLMPMPNLIVNDTIGTHSLVGKDTLRLTHHMPNS